MCAYKSKLVNMYLYVKLVDTILEWIWTYQ